MGSDRLREVKLEPKPPESDRSQVATETRDSAIGRRVVFSRDSGDRKMAISGKNEMDRNDRGPIKRVPNDPKMEGYDQKR